MKFAIFNRSIAALKPLALVSTLATLTLPAAAQTLADQKLAPVTVSLPVLQAILRLHR